jgi:hypothetical protein
MALSEEKLADLRGKHIEMLSECRAQFGPDPRETVADAPARRPLSIRPAAFRKPAKTKSLKSKSLKSKSLMTKSLRTKLHKTTKSAKS